MRTTLVTISARRDSFTPGAQDEVILDTHYRGQSGIEVSVNLHRRIRQLMARLTVGRDRGNSRLRVMASETPGMTIWNCLEGALLQPECIA